MRPLAAVLLLALATGPAAGDSILAARTIRAQSILTEADIVLVPEDIVGAHVSAEEVVGLEARGVLYAGRPIRIGDLGPPAIVDRNQIVTLIYRTGAFSVAAEGRALARAGAGDRLRVMNLSSRQTITGLVLEDGSVDMSPPSIPPIPQQRTQ